MGQAIKQTISPVLLLKIHWRPVLMIVLIVGSLMAMMFQPPFGQSQQYHNFADQRAFFNIPNFFDVMSNLAFLMVGIGGLAVCLKKHLGGMRNAWIILFAGIALVSAGSAYYHWTPNNQTLVWDRLPMTIGFMGLFAALLGEYISEHLGKLLLFPALLLGLASVIYWHWSDDLRFYIWVQLIPLLTIPVIMLLYRAKYSHQWLLLVALGLYALAKLTELADASVFALSRNLMSGHTIKHLLSAAGCLALLFMLQKRRKYEF